MCKFYELWSLFLYRFEIYIIYDLYIYEQQSFLYQKKKVFSHNVIKLRNDGFEGNTKNVLLFFLWKI